MLGWKNVVTVADDYSFPYTQVAGFVAEFCSLGGKVDQRIWPALGEEDYSSYIAQIPEGVDGFYLGVGGTGTVAFVKQYDQLKGNLGDKIMGGVFMTDPIIQKELGDRIVGVVTAGPTSGDSTEQAWLDHVAKVEAVYPEEAANASSVFQYNYYNNMAAILQGIEAVGGDISDGQKKLQAALADVVVESPFGPIKLDDNRQAIASNFLQQIVKGDDGKITVKTIASVPDVDQGFAGNFTPESPSVDRENPACEDGHPAALDIDHHEVGTRGPVATSNRRHAPSRSSASGGRPALRRRACDTHSRSRGAGRRAARRPGPERRGQVHALQRDRGRVPTHERHRRAVRA